MLAALLAASTLAWYTHGEEHTTASSIAAEVDSATQLAENAASPLREWLGSASKTFDRVYNPYVMQSTMADHARLLTTVELAHRSMRVPGDFVETGVAAGGNTILMMAALDDAGSVAADKRHYACDSFRGLPEAGPLDLNRNNNCSLRSRAESGAHGCGMKGGSKKDEEAQAAGMRGKFAFARNVFEHNVRVSPIAFNRMVVVEGWFNESLPPANTGLQRIAFLRMDGDLFESTYSVLNALYPLVSPGGAVYIDDYGSFGGCKLAVDKYRQEHAIRAPMTKAWGKAKGQQNNKGGSHASAAQAKVTSTPQAKAGYLFDAVWWIKE